MPYDIIGDVHGQAEKLEQLLAQLGYREIEGVYRHLRRQAVFVGDLIDRGPQNRRVIEIVRRMVEHGTAHAVMGNHEFNAICYHTETSEGSGDWLRTHDQSNDEQHKAFLTEFPLGQPETQAVIDWFKSLPLFVELEEFRVIHACWHPGAIDWIRPQLAEGNRLTDKLIRDAAQKDSAPAEGWSAYLAIETLLKGPEVELPPPYGFKDKDGKFRTSIRIGWWNGGVDATYGSIALDPSHVHPDIADTGVRGGDFVSYEHAELPVFFGHYWRSGERRIIRPNMACVDYSAGKGGPLVAYCWDKNAELRDHNFVDSDQGLYPLKFLMGAHNYSSKTDEILSSEYSGCFHCLAIIEQQELPPDDDWPQCPRCNVDSLIGSRSGFPLNSAFLSQMHEVFFGDRLQADSGELFVGADELMDADSQALLAMLRSSSDRQT